MASVVGKCIRLRHGLRIRALGAVGAAKSEANLHCIDPSSALDVAMQMLEGHSNVSFHRTSIDDETLPVNSQDFGYSLRVLHHIPDRSQGMRSSVAMLKPGVPFLAYLYYAFDNRSADFNLVWRCSDYLRRIIFRMPSRLKHLVTDALALGVCCPLARLSLLAERLGFNVANILLSYYRARSF